MKLSKTGTSDGFGVLDGFLVVGDDCCLVGVSCCVMVVEDGL